jgi:hypothetical protein
MRRGTLIFSSVLFLVSLLLLKATLAYSLKAKLFPMITLVIVLTLLIIEMGREGFTLLRDKSAGKAGEKGNVCGHVTAWVWMLGTMFMFWALGFMGTVIFLPLLYFRYQKESWWVSMTLPLGCGIFFYCLFGLVLKMPLYPGAFSLRFFG